MIILCMFSTEFIAKIHLKHNWEGFFYNYLSSKTRRSNAVQKPFVIIGYRNKSLDAA